MTDINSRLSIAVDPKLKDDANKIFNNMGLNLSTAVKMFLQQTINDRALPFKPHEASNSVPTKETLEAIEELKHPEKLKTYTNEKDMWKDILK